ncbi:MAG: ABC transporter permease [Euryarchaeota archaeon]|nr:ABC transporter permease [Euryarchaeota archaeon]
MTEAVNVGGPGEIHTKLPSDLQQVRTVIKYDILKHLRSRRLLGMLVIEALLIVLIAWLVMGEPAQPFVTTMSAFTGLAPTLIIIGATLFAGDAIVSEFQGRTGYLLFPNPVKRSSLFVGKFISSAAATALVVLIYYAIAIGLSAGISSNLEHFDLAFASLGLAILYALAATAVGLLISSFMKGSTGSLILTFFLLFLILPTVDGLFALVSYPPTPSLTYASGAIGSVMTIPYPTETVELITPIEGMGDFVMYMHTAPLITATVVMVAWTAVCMVLAYFLFRRREMSA